MADTQLSEECEASEKKLKFFPHYRGKYIKEKGRILRILDLTQAKSKGIRT